MLGGGSLLDGVLILCLRSVGGHVLLRVLLTYLFLGGLFFVRGGVGRVGSDRIGHRVTAPIGAGLIVSL